jgi:hypothetical protein
MVRGKGTRALRGIALFIEVGTPEGLGTLFTFKGP